jgi:hypothetical protein
MGALVQWHSGNAGTGHDGLPVPPRAQSCAHGHAALRARGWTIRQVTLNCCQESFAHRRDTQYVRDEVSKTCSLCGAVTGCLCRFMMQGQVASPGHHPNQSQQALRARESKGSDKGLQCPACATALAPTRRVSPSSVVSAPPYCGAVCAAMYHGPAVVSESGRMCELSGTGIASEGLRLPGRAPAL